MDAGVSGERTGMKIACVLITHLRAKVEMRRQRHLKDQPALIVDRSRGLPLIIDHSPAASNVAPGMTLEQTLCRQAGSIALEADEAAYRQEFHRMLASLQQVSDRVEGAELGTAYVRLDGLEALYGGEARLVTTLLNAVSQNLAPRGGVGEARLPAYVAARTSQPLGAVRVPPDVAGFLAPQPVDLLPIPPAVRDELRRFGLHTLDDLAAMKVEALTDDFGPTGQRAWKLAQGIDPTPLIPPRCEESIVEHAALPSASASMVGAPGTASSSAAISGISVAAATSATAAWFGGGTAVTGGLGKATTHFALSGIGVSPGLPDTSPARPSRRIPSQEEVT